MSLIVVLVGLGKIPLHKSSTLAPASGCSALPKQPKAIPRDPIAARGAAEVIGFGRVTAPPERAALSEGTWARLRIRFDSYVAGYNQFQCVSLVDVYYKLGPDGVLPADYTKPETQRLMLFLTAALDGSSAVPVFAIAPLSVSDQARPAAIRQDGTDPQMPANTDQPTFRVSLSVGKFITSLPSPEIAVTARLVNTTSKTISADDLSKLGASKWSADVSQSSGKWTATKDIPSGSLATLSPGAEYATTDVLALKGPADRRLDPGPAILTGQLTTKGKAIDAAGSQIRIDEL